MKLDKIITLIGISLVLALSGAGFNAFYQAKRYYRELVSRNQLAVFIKKENKTESLEVIKEKIINLGGVSDCLVKKPDDIFKEMTMRAPGMNDIVLTGENPFSPYFLVKTSVVNLSYIKSLKDKIMTFEGVEDVKFDQNLVSITENLDGLIEFYKFLWKAAVAAVLFLILVKYILLWSRQSLELGEFIFLFIEGLLAGLFGWFIYYALSINFSSYHIVQIPHRYIAYFLFNGLILALLLMKDQKK